VKFNGPPPTPRGLRVLRGNPGKRRLPKKELHPTPGASCPPELSKIARAEWKRLEPELLRLGTLTRIDRALLAAYCDAWSDFVWAVKQTRGGRRTAIAGNGTEIPHPAMTIKTQAAERLRKLAAEFGFSPAARIRLEFGGSEDDGDEDEKFFGPQPVSKPPPA
jgi:P27 family predicted phage terminase small subunit